MLHYYYLSETQSFPAQDPKVYQKKPPSSLLHCYNFQCFLIMTEEFKGSRTAPQYDTMSREGSEESGWVSQKDITRH